MAILIGVILAVVSLSGGSGGTAHTGDDFVATDRVYAKTAVNIREGPGTDTPVVGSLGDNEELIIARDSSEGRWRARYNDSLNRVTGYVAGDYLTRSDPESIELTEPSDTDSDRHVVSKPVEIKDWRWYSDPDFGTSGAVRYVVELQNNTDQYISSVRIGLTTYDSDGRIVDSDFTYVQSLTPGGTSSTESYADYYGTEDRAKIQVQDVNY
jgi:uncharacterized protein YraI